MSIRKRTARVNHQTKEQKRPISTARRPRPRPESHIVGKPQKIAPPGVAAVAAVAAPARAGRKSDLGLLDDMDRFVHSRIDLSNAQRTAVCLWVAHTYIYEHFKLTPKLFITAIKHGLGKSELMEVVEALSCNGIKRQGSTTESAISRLYDMHGRLTLCLDQLDGMSWENRKLINLLCDGFEVGAVKEMSEIKGRKYEPKAFVIGYPQAIGMIGDLPDQALASRCITIQMQPAEPERQKALFEAQRTPLVDRLKTRAPLPATQVWRKRLADELTPHRAKFVNWQPWDAPCACEPRTAVMWQPLFAVADHFGGEWPERARSAFAELADATDAKERIELRFLRHAVSRLPAGADVVSAEELYRLTAPGFDGTHFTKDQQGKWLGKVGVRSSDKREGGGAHKVYAVADFHRAMRRWLPVETARLGENIPLPALSGGLRPPAATAATPATASTSPIRPAAPLRPAIVVVPATGPMDLPQVPRPPLSAGSPMP
jgi:hypothetical protein